MIPARLDEHAQLIEAPRERVWSALQAYAAGLGLPARGPLRALLGTDPPSGFTVTVGDDGRILDLSGRHRFATYMLRFELRPAPGVEDGATVLAASSYADFHGLAGRAYRIALLASGGHLWSVRRMLAAVKKAAAG